MGRRGLWTGAVGATIAAGVAGAVLLPGSTSEPALVHLTGQAVPVSQQVYTRAAASAPSGVQAKSALLSDLSTGKWLWSRSVDKRLPIGSMTKAMTALVVIKAGNLDRTVTIKKAYTDEVVKRGGSSANLRVGDKVTVRQLLYAMLLPSGCDAASALADIYGPGWKGFVAKMNKQAAALGMKNTHYANYDGLPWPTATAGYSTARDQVKLGRYAMKYATFRSVVGTRTYKLAAVAGRHVAYTWGTTNHLIGVYPGMTGIKTGHTNAAGYCLLFSDSRTVNGKHRDLIGVVLNSSTTVENARFTDTTKILDWAFNTHTMFSLSGAASGLPTD